MSNFATTAPQFSRVGRVDSRPPLPVADYLRANRRRILALAAASLVIAEAVVGFMLVKPRQFEATAAVTIPSAGITPYDVGITIERFHSALVSDAALQAASKATGVDVGRLSAGVSFTRQGTSRYVSVSYQDRRRGEVVSVARAVTVAGLVRLFQPSSDAAERELTKAQKTMDAVQNEMVAFESAHGVVGNPAQLLEIKKGTLAKLTPNQPRQLATTRADIARLEPIVAAFAPLQKKEEEALRALNAAAYKRGQAHANIAASKAPSTVVVGSVHDATTPLWLIGLGSLSFFVFFPLIYGLTALWPRLSGGARH